MRSISEFDFGDQATLYYQSLGLDAPASIDEIDELAVGSWVRLLLENEAFDPEPLSPWVEAELARYPEISLPVRRAS